MQLADIGPEAIDLVIFDCDGVLIDSEVLSATVLIEAAAALGIDFDMDYVRRHFLGRSFPTVAATIRADYGRALPQGFEASYRETLLERFETDLRTTRGIEAVLTALDRPACVATSSSPPRVARSLEITGLARHFGPRVFTASQVARGKPAPDLFLFAAAKMGAAPERSLVIEDSRPGLAAARAAGMVTMLYGGGSHSAGGDMDLPPGVIALDSWADFPPALLRAARGSAA
ncbi:hypothetical protein OG2516_16506 [Oceanicola granulosus HTCC2516]|uniref:Hydrolase n=1 Tax=Oceanicola granulosus (strain ATCC BAA-861 / DSM 15982 / KCTC 12143 / HTCC2516) TaxID=314256 RepID=Q2CCI2_OCEGH|nr:HAD family hydrolase [Oceanicola granulosus]EAR50336.1 hypothetical protein OG2516_16506 [Oceanicola granulosus HTCC2516]